MATRVTHVLISDLDPNGEVPADETVEFGIDGVFYEIDLAEQEAKELRSSLDRYVQAARKTGAIPTLKDPKRAKASLETKRIQDAQIRAWAIDAGYAVKPRGALPMTVRTAWNERNQKVK
jgi:hypothetical protein